MRPRVAQWKGDNAQELDQLLTNHQARADKHADKLKIIGLGLNIELNLGDTLIVHGDRLGVRRSATEQPLDEEYVTWESNSFDKCQAFLGSFNVRLAVVGNKLQIHGDQSGYAWFELSYGDRLVKRDGQIIVSKLGTSH